MMKCLTVVIVILIMTVSLGIVGYISSIQPALAQLTRSRSPTIFDLKPWLFGPSVIYDPCIQHPLSCYGDTTRLPDFGPVCLSCPTLDVSKLKLNESIILTPVGQSVIVTKVPTQDILGQNINAQLNKTIITSNMSRPQ
jgi:hypothetical protein